MTETRIGVDVGGTFTDVALLVDGDLVTAKVPTTTDQSVGVLEGIKKACRGADIDLADIDVFGHAMTVSVNALLERDGAKTALVTTDGFRDVLEIGRQARPDLYDLHAEKPEPLVPRRRRFGLEERATAEGIIDPVDAAEVRTVAEKIAGTDAESVAVCLLYAYANPKNERRVAEILRETLDLPVSASHEVLAEFREFERTATTAANAYVRPRTGGYLGRLLDGARTAGLPEPRIMKSNGGVGDIETVRSEAITTVLSGPAAGVVGAASTGATEHGLITFDMGGTSSDVSRIQDGRAERRSEAEIGGVPIRAPMVDIETVGAGGGSIAWVDGGGALRVGPESAGSEPGPACYGRGGVQPTVTDANVVLGYMSTDSKLGGELSIDAERASSTLETLADEAGLDSAEEAARGVYRVANATMTRTIRSVTVERGYDPRDFGLVAFGGAGPMHAAALADSLDIDQILIPESAGVLSAHGLLAADESHDALQTVRLSLPESSEKEGETVYKALEDRVFESVSDPERANVERAVECRYEGQSFELTVSVDGAFDPDRIAERFEAIHEKTYGYRLDAAVEAVTLRVTATVETEPPSITAGGGGDPVRGTTTAVFPGHGPIETTRYDRSEIEPARTISTPAIVEQTESTTVVPPGWRGTMQANGTLELTRIGDADTVAGTRR